MTTFQDPPLQSRRAVRQNERDGQPSSAPSPTGPTGASPEPLTYATTGRGSVPEYDGPSFRAHRTPDPVQPTDEASDGGYRPRDFSPEGRRAASPTWAPQYGGVTDEGSIEYHTQARADPAAAPDATRAATPSRPMPQPLPVDDAQIDAIEHTLTRRELRALRDAHGITATTTADTALPDAAAAPAQNAPQAYQAPAPAVPSAAPSAAAALSAPPVAEPPVAEEPAAAAPAPAPSSRLDSALAEFDALAGSRGPAVSPQEPAVRGRRAAVQPAPAPTEAPAPAQAAQAPQPPVPLVEPPAPSVQQAPVQQAPVQQAPVEQAPVQQAPVQEAPVQQAPPAQSESAPQQAPAADGLSAFDVLFTPPSAAEQVVEATIEPEPIAAEPVAAEPVAPQAVVAEPVAPQPAPVAEAPAASAPAPVELPAQVVDDPTVAAPPVGHWSTQAQLDDETQVGGATLSGSVGANSAPLTTSALVLPSMPNHEYGPMMSGDVILTGSISLPQSFSATGAHPAQLDHHDLDHALDPGDHQVAADSSPVRAIRAVSTHTSSRNVIGTLKPKGNRALTVLIISAAAMAAVVVTLLIVGLVSGQL